MTSPTGRVPSVIAVDRRGDGTTSLTIDGRPFEFRLAVHDTVDVVLAAGQPPQVRLTLISGAVHVRDDLFAALTADQLNHEHPSDPGTRYVDDDDADEAAERLRRLGDRSR